MSSLPQSSPKHISKYIKYVVCFGQHRHSWLRSWKQTGVLVFTEDSLNKIRPHGCKLWNRKGADWRSKETSCMAVVHSWLGPVPFLLCNHFSLWPLVLFVAVDARAWFVNTTTYTYSSLYLPLDQFAVQPPTPTRSDLRWPTPTLLCIQWLGSRGSLGGTLGRMAGMATIHATGLELDQRPRF